MAKTAKVKKRQVSFHSRAARRASSPSLNLDKSAAKPAHTTRDSASPSRPSSINPHALAAKSAGVQKKQKKSNLTRAQRLRYQKGLERAEDNMDKLEKKRMKSVGKEKAVKERAKGWEDVNGDGGRKGKGGKTDGEDEVEAQNKERSWGDEVMDEADGVEVVVGDGEVKGAGKEVDVVVPESIALPVEVEEML